MKLNIIIPIFICILCFTMTACAPSSGGNETANITAENLSNQSETTDQPIEADASNGYYTNYEDNISFEYPKDWKINLSVSSKVLFYGYDPSLPDQYDKALIIYKNKNSKNYRMRGVRSKTKDSIEFLQGFQQREFGTEDHYATKFKYKDEAADKYRISKRVFAINDDYYYTFEFLCDSQKYDEFLPDFRKIAETVAVKDAFNFSFIEFFDGPDLFESKLPQKPERELPDEDNETGYNETEDEGGIKIAPKKEVVEFTQEDEQLLVEYTGRLTDKDQEDLLSFTVRKEGYVLTETKSFSRGLGRVITEIYQTLNEPPVDGDSYTDDDDFSKNLKYIPGKYIVKIMPYSDSDLGVYTFKAKWCSDQCSTADGGSSAARAKSDFILAVTGTLTSSDDSAWHSFSVPEDGYILAKTIFHGQNEYTVHTEIYESASDDVPMDKIENPKSYPYTQANQPYNAGTYSAYIYTDDDLDEDTVEYETTIKFCKGACDEY